MSTVNGLKDFFVLAICSNFPFIALKVFVKSSNAIAVFTGTVFTKNSTSKNRNCVILQRSCLEQLKERKTRGKVLS